MHIEIEIPDDFQPERNYSINVLLGYFDGITWEVVVGESQKTTFRYKDKAFLVISDAFWSQLDDRTLDYKNIKIPDSFSEFTIAFDEFNEQIVSIFGKGVVSSSNGTLYLESDIIASTFFLLSRWEEYASTKRDKHNRFPDEESFLVKNGLMHRPIVNEYIYFLKYLLSKVANESIELNRSYEAFITHDVDEIYRFSPVRKFIKALAGDIVLRKSPKQFLLTCKEKWHQLTGKQNDPSDTFDFLMDTSEKYGLTSRFYFIPGEKGELDFRYSISDKKVITIIKKITSRNHIVGIHPSLETNGNKNAFNEELKRLKNVSGLPITEGRHHYLAFQVPYTWRFWENNDLELDSTLGFRTCAGFRCGMCYTFPVFDILERKILKVQELPLTFMEVARSGNSISAQDFEKDLVDLVQTVKTYQGDFVLLWHNNNLHHPFYRKYGKRYEALINQIAK